MKKFLKNPMLLLGSVAFLLAALFSLVTGSDQVMHLFDVAMNCITNDTVDTAVQHADVGGVMAGLIATKLLFKNKDGEEEEWTPKSPEEISKMTKEESKNYHEEWLAAMTKAISYYHERIDNNKQENKDDILKEVTALYQQQNKLLDEQYKKKSLELAKLVKEIEAEAKQKTGNFEDNLKKAWDEHQDDFDHIAKQDAVYTEIKKEFTLIIDKATQTYGDITLGQDYAQFRPGVTDQPVRRPRIRSLFSTIPLSTEYYKYAEQNTVIRDAQNVAKCVEVSTNTKETIIVRTMETKVIKDIITFCRVFVSDYPFMQSRIRKLLDESVSLREDNQLLLGDGLNENTFSIDFYSSEFDAANPVFPIDGDVPDASMVDLIIGMKRQIESLGELNAFMPNYVLVNLRDWYINVESRKDTQGRYIDSRVVYINGRPFIDNMEIIPLVNVPINNLYVFDSMKAEVLDRMRYEVEVSFENKDNWEKELADIKGMIRVNLWCPNEWQNAFMKCSDIELAIEAIDKV